MPQHRPPTSLGLAAACVLTVALLLSLPAPLVAQEAATPTPTITPTASLTPPPDDASAPPATTNTNPDPTTAAETTTYTTSDGSFSFDYPAGWTRAGDTAGNVVLAPSEIILQKSGPELLPGEFQLEVLAPAVGRQLTLLPPGLSPQAVIEQWLAQLPANIEITDSGSALMVGDNAAYRAIAKLDTLDWLMLAVEVADGEVALLFGFGPDGEALDMLDAIRPLAASLRYRLPAIDRAALTPLTPSNATTATNLALWTGHNTSVRNLDFSADGSRLASADTTSVILVHDTASGNVLHTYTAQSAISAGPVFLPGGERVLLGTVDGEVFVVDVSNGEIVREYAPLSDTVWDVAVGPDGRYIAAVGRDLTARAWQLDGDGAPAAIFTGHRADIVSVAFAAGGEQIVTGSLDGTVRLYNIATGNQILMLFGGSDAVSSVDINASSTLVAAGGTDGTVTVFELGTQEIVWQASGEDGAAAAVSGVAFSADGSLLAAAAEDGTVRLWSAANGVPVTAFSGPSLMNDVAFSQDGRLLAAANQAGVVLAWGVR